MPEILIIDDDEAFATAVRDFLSMKGMQAETATSPQEGLKKAASGEFSIILLDLIFPDADGLEFIPKLSLNCQFLIVLTAREDLSAAVRAMKSGAFDFITKPVDLEALYFKLIRLSDFSAGCREELQIIGASRAIERIKNEIKLVARSKIPVLIAGETGVGKELVARSIHLLSGRRGEFVDVNTAAIPEHLFESELFGYRKGAFTGAVSDKKGLFEKAHRGTIFLDEITELPRSLQPKLLRVLETGIIRPLGSTVSKRIDFRLITATNTPLQQLPEKLREDLFYRISSFVIEIPPLRERPEDIIPLARHFLSIFGREKGIRTISPEAEKALTNYPWPGNVRELKSEIERACLLCRGREIKPEHLSEKILSSCQQRIKPLSEVEREYIERVLRLCGGNKSKAAKLLGISRLTLRRKLQKPGS